MARVTMFVLNDCRSDARVLREAGALAADGYRVTIMARPRDLLATVGDQEERDGIRIIRVPIPGQLRRLVMRSRPVRRGQAAPREASTGQRMEGGAAGGRATEQEAGRNGGTVVGATRGPKGILSGLDFIVRWRLGVGAWCRAAALASPDADVWHAHDLDTLSAAARCRTVRGGRLVYDTHEIFLEAGRNARRPAWARSRLAASERRMAREADAVLTVNDPLADLFAERWGIRRPTVILNCPPAWTPPASPPDRLREELELPPGTPLVLYHGGFLSDRGLPELIAALGSPALATAHLALLGEGPLEPRLRALAAGPTVAGRVHLLAPVPPDELLPWVASADVGAMPNQPRTLNERLSTPNKLFESLAAGLPVVSSDFPARRRIILDDPDGPLGAVCDPTDPAAIATSIAGILDRPAPERAALRARVLAAAHARYTWEGQVGSLRTAYARLIGSGAS
jgi:glycosyltransferase involved in cell wall biosynthesis